MCPEAALDMKTTGDNAGKLYDALKAQQAPAHVGQPVFAKDIEFAGYAGAKGLADILGHVERGDNVPIGKNLNFGSKADCALMPEETRLRLWHLKKLYNACELQAAYINKTASPTPGQIMDTPIWKHQLAGLMKAFNVTDFATWIPTVNARFYFEEWEIPLLLGDLFDQLPMESASVVINGALGRLFGRLETDTATFSAQSNTSTSYNVAAKNNVVHATITEDLNQDSMPAAIDKMRKEVVAGVARAEERSYLDGDDSVTHMDSDVVAATDFRKAWKGIRKRGLANSANGSVYDHNGDAPSKELFRQLLKKAGRFATDKADLAWLFGTTIGTDLVTGAIPELFTAFAFGGPASNVTGQVPPVFGIKGVESEYFREDLDATGVYSGAGALTWMALVKKSRLMRHLRAPIRVWAAPSLPSSDIMLMTAKKRHSFSAIPQDSQEKTIIIGINIDTQG